MLLLLRPPQMLFQALFQLLMLFRTHSLPAYSAHVLATCANGLQVRWSAELSHQLQSAC